MTSWSRAEPKTLLPATLAMYAKGRTRSEVLEAIYGVDLPPESLLLLREFAYPDKGLAVSWRYHPWELMVAPEQATRRAFQINDYNSDEDALTYSIAPNVVLLGRLGYAADSVPFGGSLFGYDLDDLRAGRSTVVGLPKKWMVSRDDRFTVFGPSVVDVLLETISSYLPVKEHRSSRDRHEDHPKAVREQLVLVEAVQRELNGA